QTPRSQDSSSFPLSVSDMTCLICFHQFSLARLPKLLACQHAFCTACLKMILQQDDRTWIISCPLCRKSTVVFGGLICSLPNLQQVVEQLWSPDPDAHPSPEMQSWDSGEINQAALKRLFVLLLLVSMLIVFILPFTNVGLLTWFLSFVNSLLWLLLGRVHEPLGRLWCLSTHKTKGGGVGPGWVQMWHTYREILTENP
uniref:RING-type domain-containing protein n=1 Tax=Laticauda laticaudata TaxID=8630 RepID=A0A8C5RXL0_LATLA